MSSHGSPVTGPCLLIHYSLCVRALAGFGWEDKQHTVFVLLLWSSEVNFHCSRSGTCHQYSLFQELGALPVSIDVREPPGSVSEEVGGVHGSVQGVKGAEHPQLARLGSEVSRSPAHVAAQAVPGAVIHQEPDQV